MSFIKTIKNKWKTEYTPALLGGLLMLIVFLFTDRYIGRHMEGTDAFRKMFYLLSAAVALMTALAYYLLKIRKVRLEYVFLPVFLILGLSFSLMIPPIAAPDESLHLGFVYAEAEKMRGWDTNEYNEDGSVGTQFLRRIEAEHDLKQIDIDHDYYAALFPRLTEKEGSGELVELKYSNNHEVPHLLYWPGAIGINIGRSLHLGAVPTFYIGRFLNLVVFLAMGFYALKRMPFGKELLFAVMLFPMTIQEVNSFSCDSMILGLSFLAAGLIFHFAYGDIVTCGEVSERGRGDEKESKGKLGQRAADRHLTLRKGNGKIDPVFLADFVLLFGSTFLLSQCKYGACVPVCLMTLLIALRKWKTNRFLTIAALAITAAGLFGGFLPSMYRTFHSVVLTNAAAPNYTAGFVLTHPAEVFYILGNTIHTYLDHYIYSMIGTSLGWYYIVLPRHLGVFFLVILFFLMLRREEDFRIEKKGEKWLIGLCCLFGVVTAVGGMLIGNTPDTETEIIGVQGRYFLPYLVPFLLLLIPRGIRVAAKGQGYHRTGLFAALVLEFVFLMCMFIRAFG